MNGSSEAVDSQIVASQSAPCSDMPRSKRGLPQVLLLHALHLLPPLLCARDTLLVPSAPSAPIHSIEPPPVLTPPFLAHAALPSSARPPPRCTRPQSPEAPR